MKNDIDIDITLPGHTRYLRMISKVGEKVAHELDCPDEVRDTLSSQLAVVLTEGVTNAIKHAGGGDTNKEIHVRINVTNNNLIVKIYDDGVGFDLENVLPPCFNSNGLEERGRGIFILRSLMDTVKYRRTNGGNVLEMQKKLA